jgi:undecaprenyl-diphosphatase
MATAPLVALLAAGSAAAVLKTLVGRARPGAGLQLSAETSGSFPSGHATDTTAFVVALALVLALVVFRRPVARLATVLAAGLLSIAVAASRLVLGVHWPTDVVAGMALGAAAALITVGTAVVITRLTPPPTSARVLPVARAGRWTRPVHHNQVAHAAATPMM